MAVGTYSSSSTPKEAVADGRIADNIVYFARTLRKAGMRVGPASVVDAIDAIIATGIGTRDDFYWTLHAVLVTRHEDHPVFDEAFRLFWKSRELIEKMLAMFSPVAPDTREKEKPRAAENRVSQAMFEGHQKRQQPEEVPEVEIDARLTTSGNEILRAKDFAQMSAAELTEVRAALARLRLPDDRLATRRLVAARRGRIDPRRTLRTSLRLGGGILLPVFRARAEIAPPIVALCDISGSMSDYSRVLLHFLHALSARRRVTTFLFGTRLTNVTRQLRLKDPDAALDACSGAVADWEGGTRIGQALRAFNRDWSRRVLGQGATVLLITDGLERPADDSGDSAPGRLTSRAAEPLAELATETARLHRSCRKLVWLNPLLRFDSFAPKAGGIRAMLPHVDEFRPIHSLASIEALVAALSGETPAHTRAPQTDARGEPAESHR